MTSDRGRNRVDIRVAVPGQTRDGMGTRGRIAFVRNTENATFLTQVVFPGLEEGTVIEVNSIEFLKVVKSLFPEITQLDPRNLPDPDPVPAPRPGLPDLTGLGLAAPLPALMPKGPASLGQPYAPASSSSPEQQEPSGSSGPGIPGVGS